MRDTGLQVMSELGEKDGEGRRRRREEGPFLQREGDQMAEALSDVRTPGIPTGKNMGSVGLSWSPG